MSFERIMGDLRSRGLEIAVDGRNHPARIVRAPTMWRVARRQQAETETEAETWTFPTHRALNTVKRCSARDVWAMGSLQPEPL
jgi:hypothetical protein